MKIAIIALTQGGKKLAAKLVDQIDDANVHEPGEGQKVAEIIATNWHHKDGLVCIMAAGIVVRAIAPLLEDKLVDPCVIVMDEMGQHVISLLSGHRGGGNALAKKLAEITGGTAVITTASDTLRLAPLDLWAEEQGLLAPSREKQTAAASRLVNRGTLNIYCDESVGVLPPGLRRINDVRQADIIVSAHTWFSEKATIYRPRHLVLGIGCNRGTPPEEFEEALTELLTDLQISRDSIRNLASIDQKNDEEGLLQFAVNNGWQIEFFASDKINTLTNVPISFAALKAVGAIGVAEPTALLSAQSNHLQCRKRKWKNVTMAIARAPFSLSEQAREQSNI